MTSEKAKAGREALARMPEVEYEYEGLKPGDIVKLTGEKGTFKFQHVRVDRFGNPTDIELFGGLPGREKLRSVFPSRIKRGKK